MAGWIVHEIVPQVRIDVTRPMPVLDPADEALVGTVWEAAQRRLGGALFNGRVFCADRIAPELIEGHWTEYRRLVAQFENPAMFARLRIRSLAVNGVVLGSDGVVFGRRPDLAVYQAGLWQLAPAGSVDPSAASPDGRIDAVRQVATELREEVGLDFADIVTATPIALVEHAGSHVCDLGIAMTTRLRADAILAAHRARGDGEYGALRIVARDEIEAFAAEAGEGMARQSRVFLERLGWLAA